MLDRFGADQRQQILRHEQAHLRRGDALWSLLAEIAFAAVVHPLAIEYEPEHSTTTSANLIAAASSTVMQWRFTPATHQGKAVAGYVRVPVLFTMKKLSEPSADANPGHA